MSDEEVRLIIAKAERSGAMKRVESILALMSFALMIARGYSS